MKSLKADRINLSAFYYAFIGVSTSPLVKKDCKFFKHKFIIFSRVCLLAEPICGKQITLFNCMSGWLDDIGSSLNTSSPAAAISPDSSALYKASSSTICPRDTLIKMADDFIMFNVNTENK